MGILLAGLFFLGAVQSHAALFYQPGRQWKVLTTENFEIIFYEGEEFLAAKTAVIAEDVLKEITKLLLWTPKGRIRIVLSDNTDDSNGMAQAWPWNTIRIFVALPHSENRLDYYDDWLRTVLSHELTHTVHIDSVRAIPKGMRAVFGRTFFIHHVQPIMLVEGLAVHHETLLTTRGRNRSTTTSMMLRAAIQDDRFPTIDELSHWTRRWPAGALPYIFGGVFHDFLAREAGPEALGEYSMKHAGQIWPFLFNHNAKLIFGQKLSTLWLEFQYYNKDLFQKQDEKILEKPLTPSMQITHAGRQHRRPRWLEDGTIIVAQAPDRHYRRLLRVDPATGKIRTLFSEGSLRGACPVPGTADIVYSRIPRDDPWTEFNDLFIFNRESGKDRRLTRSARLRDPVTHPGGKFAVAVAQDRGATKLVRVDLNTGLVEDLTSFDRFSFDTQLGPPAFSPDGKILALSIWHDDGNRDIFFYHIAQDRFERITGDPARDIDPVFSLDGNTLYFVSDRTGVHNVYSLDLRSENLFRVTNVLTGVFEPALSPDGSRLALIHYSSRGFDLHVMELSDALQEKVEREKIFEDSVIEGKIGRSLRRRAHEAQLPEEKYSAGKSLLPSYWVPTYSTEFVDERELSRLGFETSGMDTILRHTWSLAADYDLDNEFLNGFFQYSYERFAPSLRLSLARNGLDYGNIAEDETGDTHRLFQERSAVAAGFRWALFERFSLFSSYLFQYYQVHMDLDEARNRVPDDGVQSGPRLGVIWNGTLSFPMSITRERGGVYLLTGAVDHRIFASDYNVMAGVVSLSQYISLPWYSNVLNLRIQGGVAQGDLLYRRSFIMGGFNQVDLSAQTSRNIFALRGYTTGAFRGDRALAGMAEHHTPIWYQQRGIGTWPVFLDVLSGSVFANAGKTWDGRLNLEDPGRIPFAYGISLRQSFGVAYYYGLSLRFIYAFAPDKVEPSSYFLGLGSIF